ncbi:MAG: ATP-dependent DNA ligase [Candidatus Thermoplasmatota archaeon]|nr:ATP-dependent DNA ligase [Candidatus Thermoplasmatota archaeon]
MLYSEIVGVYERIEATTKRLEMTDYLVELFKSTPSEIIDKVVYLTQGKLYPDYVNIELGVGEKLCLKALAFASGINEKELEKIWKKTGDLGTAAFETIAKRHQTALFFTPLTVTRVYNNFEKIAKATGSGAQELKIKLIAELLHDSEPKEAKYIIRSVLGKLRLGIADMTILDALAIAFADKKEREELERAYNICSDLGTVAKIVAEKGVEDVKKVSIKIGVPVRMMLAERLTSVKEIIEKLGRAVYEYKYDGLRIQAHIDGKKISLFSRHLENITAQFPDLQQSLKVSFKSENGIVEGECVPVNINTNELLPFQEVAHRRGRKYEVKEASADYPVVLFLFDCLYENGKDLTKESYLARRKILEKIITPSEQIRFAEYLITDKIEEIDDFFCKAVEAGCEGLVAKSIKEDSFYRAGARGWQWIKYKRDYKSEMVDTVDLVAVGAFVGKGRRAGTYGALLMGCYNKEKDVLETVCKLASGFDDETLFKLPEMFKDSVISKPHARVSSQIKADYWFVPKYVLEVLGAEITSSPVHTCAYNAVRKGSGLAIRFPRFTGKLRKDKAPEDATTSKEIEEMYKKQLKKAG